MSRRVEEYLIPDRQGMLSREIDVAAIARALRNHPVAVVMGLGVLLRVGVYLISRGYGLDEASLLGNLRRTAVLDFSAPLTADQLAPIGFLAIERIVVRLLGAARYATRLLPLGCGIASLWLFRRMALRRLPFRAALVALVLFAFSDDLVHYSSELKPYSSDVALGLAILVAASEVLERPLRRRDTALLGLLAVGAPWLSFPSALFVAGCGVVLLVDRLRRAWWHDAARLVLIALAWAVSFRLAYRASLALLVPTTSMYVFWDFAFLPLPPGNQADLIKSGGVVLEAFVNPLNLIPSWCPASVVVLPLLLWLLGGLSLARRDARFFLMLSLPILLALIAAALRKYPFHGRLVLALVPAFFLMIAEGTEWLRARLGPRVYRLVVIVLLGVFSAATLYQVMLVRARDFNAHGDLHTNRFVE
jgi:hypothetical protein